MSNLNEIRSLIRQMIKEESFSEDVYSTRLQNFYNEFQQLEQEYNKYNLIQLKNDYKINVILERYNELKSKFEILKSNFNQQEQISGEENWYQEIDNMVYSLQNKIDEFGSDLEMMNDALKNIGDLDKGSHYFSKPLL